MKINPSWTLEASACAYLLRGADERGSETADWCAYDDLVQAERSVTNMS